MVYKQYRRETKSLSDSPIFNMCSTSKPFQHRGGEIKETSCFLGTALAAKRLQEFEILFSCV